MPRPPLSNNVTATVIRSLLQHTHQVSISSIHNTFSLKADVVELDIASGKLTLETQTSAREIHSYIENNSVSLDIESTKNLLKSDKDIFSLSNVPVKTTKIDLSLYNDRMPTT